MKEKILTELKNNLWVVVLDIIAVNAAFMLVLNEGALRGSWR